MGQHSITIVIVCVRHSKEYPSKKFLCIFHSELGYWASGGQCRPQCYEPALMHWPYKSSLDHFSPDSAYQPHITGLLSLQIFTLASQICKPQPAKFIEAILLTPEIYLNHRKRINSIFHLSQRKTFICSASLLFFCKRDFKENKTWVDNRLGRHITTTNSNFPSLKLDSRFKIGRVKGNKSFISRARYLLSESPSQHFIWEKLLTIPLLVSCWTSPIAGK